jgi:hypothetical protein
LKASKFDVFFSDVFTLPVHFEFLAIFSYCLHFAKFVYILVKQRKDIYIEHRAGKAAFLASWFGLEKKKGNISQIIEDYFYLPFFLLIILCKQVSDWLFLFFSLMMVKRKDNNFGKQILVFYSQLASYYCIL